MAGVASAAIIEGQLIIGLDDGTIIRAGYVQGPQGLKGDPGPMGATGERGTDGNTIHTVAGTPRNDMGTDGDYAIDNINWRIYGPKSGGVWGKAKEMLPGPENVLENGRMTAMTGGGGGAPGKAGSTDIIIGPNAPNLGDALTGLKPGQLWFDSDQLALYILVTDGNNQRVWVIVTPADRTAVQDVVNTFTFPATYGAQRANSGDTVYNTTTNLWYVYNGKKNQWIDLPPGINELSMQAILLRGPTPMDASFEYDPNDRVTYETDALCYVDEDDHFDFTRIVIPGIDSVGFDWRFILRGIKSGDQLSLVQIDPGADPDDSFPFRSDYLTVNALTENSESFSAEVSFVSENPLHLPIFGETVAIRFKAIVNIPGGAGEIYYQEDAPNPDADPDLTLEEGNVWIDSDDNKLYVWNGSSWSEVTACTGQDIGDFVKRSGDSMTGALVMDSAGEIEMINTAMEMRRTMPNDGTGNWDANRSRYGIIRSRIPRIVESDGTETIASGASFGIEVDLSDRNTYRNELKVSKKDEDIFRVTSGANPAVVFNTNIDRSNMPDDKGIPKGVEIRGIPTPDKDLTPGNYVANKEYVDQREEFLHNEIIELEEELDAIAPSVERGTWKMTLSGGALDSGDITFYDGTFGNGSPIGIFKQAQSVWFSANDTAGVPHGFSNVEPGHLLELFVQGESDYGLFEVVEVHDLTVGSPNPYYAIDVNFIRALSDTSKADPNDLVRMKTFQAPTGGDAGSFVRKLGDSMEGNLTMESANIVFKPIVPDGDTDGNRPERWNYLISKRVRDADNNIISGGSDFGIRVDLTEGRTSYNSFQFFANVDGQSEGSRYVSFSGGNNPTFKFHRGSFKMEGNRIQDLGDPIDATDAVNKRYIDQGGGWTAVPKASGISGTLRVRRHLGTIQLDCRVNKGGNGLYKNEFLGTVPQEFRATNTDGVIVYPIILWGGTKQSSIAGKDPVAQLGIKGNGEIYVLSDIDTQNVYVRGSWLDI